MGLRLTRYKYLLAVEQLTITRTELTVRFSNWTLMSSPHFCTVLLVASWRGE
jgi:hypothetical protein